MMHLLPYWAKFSPVGTIRARKYKRMDKELHRALAVPAINGLAQLLAAIDPEEEIQAGGLAALTRLIADAARPARLDRSPPPA